MARYTGSVCRLCRREGTKLFLKGDRCFSEKCAVDKRAYPPGQHGQGRPRFSDYGLQLREKQKVKRMYGLLERQFERTLDQATRMKGRTGENLLALLERRLDNVVFRMGFATSRAEARQLVRHGHFLVNGRKTTIPSLLVKTGAKVSRARELARRSRASSARSTRSKGAASRSGSRSTRNASRAPSSRCRRAKTSRFRSRNSSSSSSTPADPATRKSMQQELIARNWRELIRPRRLEADDADATDRYARFWCEPLERGFGQTLGNSLRRVLLSSLQGAAITVGEDPGRAPRVLDHPRGARGRERHRPEPEGGAAAHARAGAAAAARAPLGRGRR